MIFCFSVFENSGCSSVFQKSRHRLVKSIIIFLQSYLKMKNPRQKSSVKDENTFAVPPWFADKAAHFLRYRHISDRLRRSCVAAYRFKASVHATCRQINTGLKQPHQFQKTFGAPSAAHPKTVSRPISAFRALCGGVVCVSPLQRFTTIKYNTPQSYCQ